MKSTILLFWLIMIPVAYSNGQAKSEDVAYLDSVSIDLYSTYIHPANITDIQVDSKNRALHIYSAKPINFLTLDWICEKYAGIKDPSDNIVYMVDDKLIKDKSKIKIDSAFFLTINIYKLEEVMNINRGGKKITVVAIILSVEKPQPKVFLRGQPLSSIKENN